MSEELLSLKWNNHQSHFVDILTFLREQEIFIDATLACGGKLYPAHKFVLSTCSDYFKQMFTKNPSKHPIVFMKDVSCRDLEALLDFMYNGEVNVPQSSLGSLIKTAEGLQIKGLAVPDDPPIPSKRESALLRDRRELKASRDNSYSPSPKRLRAKDKSPPPFSSSRSKSPMPVHAGAAASTALSSGVDTNNIIDEDSRTSALSDSAVKTNSSSNSNNNSHLNNEDIDTLSRVLNREPSPGPSGLHKNTPQHSKEEELDIKQEDVVDLGEHEEGDWGGGGDGDGRGDESLDDGGGGDSLTSENNTPNFSDVLGPATDGSLNTSGDPAMGLIPDLPFHPMVLLDEVGSLRPHMCNFCGRRFKRKDHRLEHERIHTGERPFVCGVCGRAFIQKHQLVSHTRRKHESGDRSSVAATSGPLYQPQHQEGGSDLDRRHALVGGDFSLPVYLKSSSSITPPTPITTTTTTSNTVSCTTTNISLVGEPFINTPSSMEFVPPSSSSPLSSLALTPSVDVFPLPHHQQHNSGSNSNNNNSSNALILEKEIIQ